MLTFDPWSAVFGALAVLIVLRIFRPSRSAKPGTGNQVLNEALFYMDDAAQCLDPESRQWRNAMQMRLAISNAEEFLHAANECLKRAPPVPGEQPNPPPKNP